MLSFTYRFFPKFFALGCLSLLCLLGQMVQAATRNVLIEEVADLDRLSTEVQNLIKSRKVEPSSGGKYVQNVKKRIELMQQRNDLLQESASSSSFCIYASTKDSATKHLVVAEKVLKDYVSYFKNLNFNPQTPAQILLYPERTEYLKYDGVHAQVLGHAISNRQKSLNLIRRGNTYLLEELPSSTKKFHRLATFEQENPYVFAHEVCHMLTFEMLNPQQMDLRELKPNMFLNEGLSEFFAAHENPDVFKGRAAALVFGKKGEVPTGPTSAADVMKFLKYESYPQDMMSFYSEATLVTRWLMDLPSGAQVVKTLLNSPIDQMESVLRIHQRAHKLPDDSFAGYIPYRKKVLEELQASVSKPSSSSHGNGESKKKKKKKAKDKKSEDPSEGEEE
jgi:hypothetical protein